MKKILKCTLCLALAGLMCVNVFAAGFGKIRSYEEDKFKDVSENAWYAESVKSAYEKGLVNGATEETFNPDGEITIAETITLAARIHSTYNSNGYEFRQTGNKWYQTYVDYATENAIIGENEYADYTKKSNRLDFVSIIAASVPEREFEKINEILLIHDLDESYDKSKRDAVYLLYNAGVLTGSDELGSFRPETSITRSEVAAILARITDTSQRKKYTLAASESSETTDKWLTAEQSLKFTSPEIDFSDDDGTKSRLLLEARLMFEQKVLWETLFKQEEDIGSVIVEDPDSFAAYVDNQVWTACMNTVAIRYMTESDEMFVIEKEEDIPKYINDIADRFSLHAYENYEYDPIKLDEESYCVLLCMADIGDSLKVNELDKMFISPYVAIVCDKGTKKLRYFILERSMDGVHMFCEYGKGGEHINYGVMEKDKKAFLEGIKEQISK